MTYVLLGRGPITEALASSILRELDVVIFSNNTSAIKGVRVENYKQLQTFRFDKISGILFSWRTIDLNNKLLINSLLNLKSQLSLNSKLVNMSSVAVYGNCNFPVLETTETNPINNYGREKLQLEKVLGDIFGTRLLNLRISNVFGDTQFDDIVNRLITSYLKKLQSEIVSPNRVYRDFIHISDLLTLIKKLLLDDHVFEGGVINVASGFSMSLMEVRNIIENITGDTIDCAVKDLPSEVIEVSRIDCKKMSMTFDLEFNNPCEKLAEYVRSILPKL